MVIDTNNLNGVGSRASQTRSAPNNNATSSDAPAKGRLEPGNHGDSVQLSSQAQTMGRIQANIEASPDVDMSKVEAIKAAISEGRFEINAEAIAEKMLSQDALLG